MNIRGSAQDVLLTSILLFALGVGFLIMNFVGNTITDQMLNVSVINESAATVEVLESGQAKGINTIDWWILGIFLGLTISLIVTSWYVSANPLFIFIYFIVLIIGVLISMVLSNTWETISQSTILVSSLVYLPITNHILLYLPYYTTFLGLLGIVIMFGKPGFSQGGDL